jgi:imidazole glycerol-phosphate synthase subunit HisH
VTPRDVVIIENGGANIASLQFALERLNVASTLTAEPQRIRAASHVILPGVGAAADAMQRLRERQLHTLLPQLRQPVLGICLGMQLLFEASDEGSEGDESADSSDGGDGGVQCLGIIPGRARKFAPAAGRPVPHMGWNTLQVHRPSALLRDFAPDAYAYFVHSYALDINDATIASSSYGISFSACVEWRNFYGAQFHPERSAAVGSSLLQNFLAL